MYPGHSPAVSEGTLPLDWMISQHDYPITPTSEAPPRLGENVVPTRKVAIWDLVNHSVEEEEQHRQEVLASTPRTDIEEDRQDYFGNSSARAELNEILNQARSQISRHSHRPSPLLPSPVSASSVVLQANIAKRRKATSGGASNSHISWRLGMPQSPRSLSLSKEDSQIEQILLQTTAFYTGNFESSWSAHLREGGAHYFDKIADTERFAGSITTAGGLIAIGRIDAASSILDHTLPTFADLLVSPHPQLYFLLADLSFSANSDTALGRLRTQVKQYAAFTALRRLGHMHPITRLLHLTFTDSSDVPRLLLREQVQRRIHALLAQQFGPDSYQTTGQYYYLARVLSQIGRLEESHKLFSEVVKTWNACYGANHMLPIRALLEMTRLRLSLNDASLETETLLSDTLRRTLTLEKTVADEPTPDNGAGAGGINPKLAGLVNARIGCVRTLGRLHVMRGNLQTALMQYTCAVSVGMEELGAHVPAVQLALADRDAAGRMIAANAEGDQSVRLEWLGREPVEVGLRWQEEDGDRKGLGKGK